MIIIFFVFIFIQDLEKYLALSILMAIFYRPRIPDYWSTDTICYSPIFPTVMSRNQNQLIIKMLHFADNSYWYPTDENHTHYVDTFEEKYGPLGKSGETVMRLMMGELGFHLLVIISTLTIGKLLKAFIIASETSITYCTNR